MFERHRDRTVLRGNDPTERHEKHVDQHRSVADAKSYHHFHDVKDEKIIVVRRYGHGEFDVDDVLSAMGRDRSVAVVFFGGERSGRPQNQRHDETASDPFRDGRGTTAPRLQVHGDVCRGLIVFIIILFICLILTDIKFNNNIIIRNNIAYHLTTKLTCLLNSHK